MQIDISFCFKKCDVTIYKKSALKNTHQNMHAFRSNLIALKAELERDSSLAKTALSGGGATPRASTRRMPAVELKHTTLNGVGVVVLKGSGPQFDASVRDMHAVHERAPEVTPEVLLDTRDGDGRLVVVSASTDVENGNVASQSKRDPLIVEECAAAIVAAATRGVGAKTVDLRTCHVIGDEGNRFIQINGLSVGGQLPTAFVGGTSAVQRNVAAQIKALMEATAALFEHL
jgi:hypothetical protein